MLLKQFVDKFPKDVSFSWFMNRKGEVFRDVDGRKTLRFVVQGRSYFIKIHTGVGWKEILKNLVQLKNPVLGAENEFLAIRRLTDLGIDTMTLVAYASKGWNPAKIQSFVVTEELTNTISLEDYCANWPENPPEYAEKQILIRKVASIARNMHENGINHRDFYICHFLISDNADFSSNIRLFLIDLHRVQIRNKIPQRWLIKDLAALYFSAMHIGLTRKDFYRFIKIYRGQTLKECFKKESELWKKIEQKAFILNEMPDDKKKR